MAWVAVEPDLTEWVFETKPLRDEEFAMWVDKQSPLDCPVAIPKGSIKKLIGREITWENEPVELKEQDNGMD